MDDMALYKQLKNTIINNILNGTYMAGKSLPTEQELCEQFKMSRVTVRKALDDLKMQGMIASVQGSGTIVCARESGFSGSMEIVVMIAEVHNPFFASFMAHFERVAEENGSLALFKQDFEHHAFQSSEIYYRLLTKGIRNIVLWPQSDSIDFQLLRQVRAAGINMAIFDQMFTTPVADIVTVDNSHAIQSLYSELRKRCDGPIFYIGYSGIGLPSELGRRQSYIDAGGEAESIYTLPWGSQLEQELDRLFAKFTSENRMPSGIVCTNGSIGLAVAEKLKLLGQGHIPVAAVDDLPGMATAGIIRYAQPLKEMAELIYQRLVLQNNHSYEWTPITLQVKGHVLK
jgi:DNA-binding LacI/PurR family transcriptional regulator